MAEVLEWETKTPTEAVEYGIDFTKSLATGDSLATIAYSYITQAGLSKTNERIDGTIARVKVSSGNDGQIGHLRCDAHTTLGEDLVEEVIVRIFA